MKAYIQKDTGEYVATLDPLTFCTDVAEALDITGSASTERTGGGLQAILNGVNIIASGGTSHPPINP